MKAEAERAKAERDKEQAEFKEKQESWWDRFGKKKTIEEKRAEEYAEIGFKPAEYFEKRRADIAEMESLYDSYNAKVKERDIAVAGVEGVGMPQGWIDDRKIVITNKYNAELNSMAAMINSKAAIMEARQNNFNEARSFANDAVSNYTADLYFEYKRYEEFVDMNMDLLDSLGAEYKEFVEGERVAMLQKLTLEEQEKTEVMKLVVDSKGQAGIDINDSLEEAREKYNQWAGAQVEGVTEFTKTQKLALEQAGLAFATRQQQLNYLQGQGLLGGMEAGSAEFQTRANKVERYMSARVGTDGLISSETYHEAHKLWTQLGGTDADWDFNLEAQMLIGIYTILQNR